MVLFYFSKSFSSFAVHRINQLKFGIRKQNGVFIHQPNILIKFGVSNITIRAHNLFRCLKIKASSYIRSIVNFNIQQETVFIYFLFTFVLGMIFSQKENKTNEYTTDENLSHLHVLKFPFLSFIHM